MASTLVSKLLSSPAATGERLPLRLRLLLVVGPRRIGGWMADQLSTDDGCPMDIEETRGLTAGLERIRDEVFDAVLIGHEGHALDALELLDAVHTAGGGQRALIVLGEASEEQMTALCYEAGADAYVCANASTTRTLLWRLARAVERHRLIAENRRHQNSEQHRLRLEHDEASRMLEQQRALICGLEQIHRLAGSHDASLPAPPSGEAPAALPDTLEAHYRELLRAYVIMGTGNLGEELRRLAETLTAGNVGPQQMMQAHLEALEEMVRGLGSRSSRHVINRADLLILEVMMHLAEGYRVRVAASLPPRQMALPGF